jgi:site-specific recombinase XerD
VSATTATTQVTVDIPALIPSWQRSLRAARRSARTVQSYTGAVHQVADLLVRRGMPTAAASLRREHVEAFIEDLDTRFKPATVDVRFRSLQQLFRWMLEEGEITQNPLERMRPRRVSEDPPAVLWGAELRMAKPGGASPLWRQLEGRTGPRCAQAPRPGDRL